MHNNRHAHTLNRKQHKRGRRRGEEVYFDAHGFCTLSKHTGHATLGGPVVVLSVVVEGVDVVVAGGEEREGVTSVMRVSMPICLDLYCLSNV